MFNASEMSGNNLFNVVNEKGCWLQFGDYGIITADKRPVGSRESSPKLIVLWAVQLFRNRGDKVRNGSKNRQYI
jgi:hypothetical protein